MQIAPIKQAPIGQVFHFGKMAGVTLIVTDVELVIKHSPHAFRPPKKGNSGRRGGYAFRLAHDFQPIRVSQHYFLNQLGRKARNCQTLACGTRSPHWLTAARVMPKSSASAFADPAFCIAYALSILRC